MADLVLEPLVLLCPSCGRQHIDEGDLAIEPHADHVCLHCGHEWRPREHATVGVPLGTLSSAWLFEVARVHGRPEAKRIHWAWAVRESVPPIEVIHA